MNLFVWFFEYYFELFLDSVVIKHVLFKDIDVSKVLHLFSNLSNYYPH